MELELYRRYTRHEAIAACGASGEPRELCDGHWVIFPKEAICFADIGGPLEENQESHFLTGACFLWLPDKPYQVSDSPYSPFLPVEVRCDHPQRRVIRLFARRGHLEDFIYIGILAPDRQVPERQDRHAAAYFDLSPVIPSKLWAELRGSPLVLTDPTIVDSALHRLRGTTTADDRFAILQTLVEFWEGPITPEDGLPEEAVGHLRMPTPLRRWYRWAGRRNIFNYNYLAPPAGAPVASSLGHLKYVDGRLVYCWEHQGIYLWSTLPDGDDPIVFGRLNKENEPWVAEDLRLTEHLISLYVFEAAAIGAPYGVHVVSLDRAVFDQIAERIPPLAIPPWRYQGMRFYGGNGAFMFTWLEDEESATISIGAKTDVPLQFLQPLIKDTWDYVAI